MIYKSLLVLILIATLILLVAAWWVAGRLLAPAPADIGPPPADLAAINVAIEVPGRPTVHGWWVAGLADQPAVLLLHGIRSNRQVMLGRARALAARGYGVLLIDLPAHGESAAKRITLGWQEAAAVTAARQWMQLRKPHARLGVIAVSLGGASVLLGPMPCGFDAVVLESVYPDIHAAIGNRLAMRFGPVLAVFLGPLLELQLRPRMGIGASYLRPIDHIAAIGAPLLIVSGARDRHTTRVESERMYAQAVQPKALWVVADAAHESFFDKDRAAYTREVFAFLDRHLQAR